MKDCIFVHASGFIGGNNTYDVSDAIYCIETLTLLSCWLETMESYLLCLLGSFKNGRKGTAWHRANEGKVAQKKEGLDWLANPSQRAEQQPFSKRPCQPSRPRSQQ